MSSVYLIGRIILIACTLAGVFQVVMGFRKKEMATLLFGGVLLVPAIVLLLLQIFR